MTEVVRFRSEGLECVADLLMPEPARAPAPALVVGRGFGGVREGNRREAAFFQAAGFVVLSIDYRFFGDSAGEPRGRLHPLEQVEDFRSAMTFLERRPEVDPQRIGLWGTSFAGGVVLYTAAVDRRVRAVVAHLPIVHGRRWLRSLRSAAEWEQLLVLLEEDRRVRFSGEQGSADQAVRSGNARRACGDSGDAEQAEHFVNLKRTQPDVARRHHIESLESRQ